MVVEYDFGCNCGKVAGKIRCGDGGVPAICCCSSCQKWHQYLSEKPGFKEHDDGRCRLTKNGGTKVFIVYPKEVTVDQGNELIKLYKLKQKSGTYRYASSCCDTPLFNTGNKKDFAMISIVASSIKPPSSDSLPAFTTAINAESMTNKDEPENGISFAEGLPKLLLLRMVYRIYIKGQLFGLGKTSLYEEAISRGKTIVFVEEEE